MKFISSSFNQRTGVSYVTMQHLGRKFTGVARVHPDDKHNASEYAGCSYAETRAIILALKYERNILKYEIKVCENFVKSIECYSHFNKEDESAKSIYRQLNIKRKKINELTNEIERIQKALKAAIKDREEILNAIEKRKIKVTKD